ncbi:MAG: DUF1559 domain-containing protein [Lentisphaeria bacterium]|nr:DUF1559 domain-containing protein [Lentisphaeria bacterium]
MRDLRELLTVALLGTALVAVTGVVSKESARRAQCQANLRELFRAEQQYEETCGSLPPLYIVGRPWKFWHSFLAPMVGDVRAFACPSDPRMSYLFEKGSPLFGGTVALTSCYGMNRFMLPAGAQKAGAPEFKLKYLKDPSHTVFIMDSLRPFVTPDLLWKDKRNFRHDGRANYIFADGSVRHLEQTFFGKWENEKFVTDLTRWHWR